MGAANKYGPSVMSCLVAAAKGAYSIDAPPCVYGLSSKEQVIGAQLLNALRNLAIIWSVHLRQNGDNLVLWMLMLGLWTVQTSSGWCVNHSTCYYCICD